MATAPKTPVVSTSPEDEARLSENAAFEGQWKGGDIAVQGRLEGELTLKGRLRVGRAGSVLGRVRADSVEIGGEFTGEIQARLIVITETARARGTFVSEKLIVKEGAVVDGAFDRPKTALAPVAAAPAPKQPSGDAQTSTAKPLPAPATAPASGGETPKPATGEAGPVEQQG
jgi:cytoskeletal protein CcmA (bactofilin family)